MTETTTEFPVDWTEWQAQWREWRDGHADVLKKTSFRWPGTNFLADERLGTWSVHGVNVELSIVVFTIGETKRYVGIVMGGSASPHTALASSFAELEKIIGIG